MPIGTSDGEFHKDEMDYLSQLAQKRPLQQQLGSTELEMQSPPYRDVNPDMKDYRSKDWSKGLTNEEIDANIAAQKLPYEQLSKYPIDYENWVNMTEGTPPSTNVEDRTIGPDALTDLYLRKRFGPPKSSAENKQEAEPSSPTQAPSYYESLVDNLMKIREKLGGDPTLADTIDKLMMIFPGKAGRFSAPPPTPTLPSLAKMKDTGFTVYRDIFQSFRGARTTLETSSKNMPKFDIQYEAPKAANENIHPRAENISNTLNRPIKDVDEILKEYQGKVSKGEMGLSEATQEAYQKIFDLPSTDKLERATQVQSARKKLQVFENKDPYLKTRAEYEAWLTEQEANAPKPPQMQGESPIETPGKRLQKGWTSAEVKRLQEHADNNGTLSNFEGRSE